VIKLLNKISVRIQVIAKLSDKTAFNPLESTDYFSNQQNIPAKPKNIPTTHETYPNQRLLNILCTGSHIFSYNI